MLFDAGWFGDFGPLALGPQAATPPCQQIKGKRAGDLRGQVTDELGGLIVGATVTLTDAKGSAKTAITNNDGRFVFGGLAADRRRHGA